jgi:hypothetical protein
MRRECPVHGLAADRLAGLGRRLVPLARTVAPLLTIALAVGLASCGGAGETTVNLRSASLAVFPIPGSRVAAPRTQIVFRGVSISQIARVNVTGSQSGNHAGRLLSDSDNDGGSFLPARPFAPGERVTVTARLSGSAPRLVTFSFRVAHPVGQVPDTDLHFVARRPGDVMRFHSRPDLDPPAVRMDRRPVAPTPGRIFVGPEEGPVQSGAMILDPDGTLVWFHPVPRGQVVSDFKVQRYLGRPVLTWFEGYIGSGAGNGEDHILDASYRQVAVVKAANGLRADMHEFDLLPGGRALITAYFPVRWADSPAPGSKRDTVLDGVVQEIDIRTGLLLFQWDSLDHVPLSASYVAPDRGKPYDYFHINGVDMDNDGNLIVSSRNTWAAYKVSHRDGHVIWRLGGKHSTFRLAPNARFAFQHDVRAQAAGDAVVTLFDNEAGPPDIDRESRGLTLRLNLERRTATLARVVQHSPPLLAHFEGNVQDLPGGLQFMGWGQRPYFTAVAHGAVVLDGHFVNANPSYRAFLEPWTGDPDTLPAVTASRTGQMMTVYVSWNGSTRVSRWRVLAGGAPRGLRSVRTVRRRGFETDIQVPAEAYLAVQALDAQGRVLGRSRTIRTG